MELRELKEKDVDGMLEWMHSKESKEIFAKDFNKYTREDVTRFANSKNTKENINYACVDDNDEYLGTVSLKNIDYENGNAEYAISFRKEAQGTGAAMYATKRILDMAFNELKLEKVYLDVLLTNKRAIGFYNKVGFVQEGEFRSHFKRNGEYVDLLWFSMLNEEYKKLYEKDNVKSLSLSK